MHKKEDRENAFAEQLAHEIAQNKHAIAEILHRSKVGDCSGMCKGWKEDDLRDLCPDCLRALEVESDEIFSASPALRMIGEVMNEKN